jgi:hypothetical protein
MRGSPLLRAALMLAALLLLIIPLRSLTVARSAAPAMPAAPVSAATQIHLELTATATPFTFTVSHLGAAIWRGESATSLVASDVSLAFPAEGIDLAVEVKWPSAQTGAVRLVVTRGDTEPIVQTAWGNGGVNDVLTFK